MKTAKNRLILDYKDLPDLKAALGGAVPGDRCIVEFELMVVSNDDNSLEGDIEKVEYEIPSEEADEEKSGEAEPTAESPVMVVIASRNKKAAKSKPAYDDQAENEDSEE